MRVGWPCRPWGLVPGLTLRLLLPLLPRRNLLLPLLSALQAGRLEEDTVGLPAGLSG